jgi:arginase family enzyme
VSESQFQRWPLPWEEPRVTVDGVVGQVDAAAVPRYGGEPTFARLPRLTDVPRADVAILGVPFDTGVSYRPGARFGPGHIRESSRLLRPYNPAAGVSPFAALQVADAGDLGVNPFDIAEAIVTIERGARALLERAPRLLTLGGDHTIALPLLRAIHAAHGPVAVVHFDAHLDTWDSYFGAPYTHGTPEAGGLTSRELLAVLRSFAALNLVGADIVEVAPAYDHAQVTGIAAAHVGYELISALALGEPAP